MMDDEGCDLLRMLAVFSVVISISGSVKYSEATHLPFSGPERRREREKMKMMMNDEGYKGNVRLFYILTHTQANGGKSVQTDKSMTKRTS